MSDGGLIKMAAGRAVVLRHSRCSWRMTAIKVKTFKRLINVSLRYFVVIFRDFIVLEVGL